MKIFNFLSLLCDVFPLLACDIISQSEEDSSMEQTVYVDIFFLVNFSMDFLALFLASRILSRKVSPLRITLAAVFGGLYACLALFLSLESISGMLSFAVDAVACVIMALIATFDRRAKRAVLSFSLVFGAVSLLLGGAMTALFYAFNKIGVDKWFSSEGETSDSVSVWLFVVLAALSCMFALLGGKFLKRKSLRQRGFVEVKYQGKKASIPCICDSGNLLREPISGLPCVLVELDALDGVFSASFRASLKRGDVISLSSREASRIRMIPTRSASGESLLFGMRVDSLSIDMGKGATEVEAYIVFSVVSISADGVKALVPSELALGAA